MSDTQELSQVQRPERRRARRFECDLGIIVEWGAASLPGRVHDISPEGMFVEIDGPLWLGARFAAQLALDEAVNVECVVNRVEPRRGMAVKYQPAGESSRAALASLFEGFAGQ